MHARLAIDGRALMASEIFGMLVDRYGTPWMVNGGAPAP
jgi:uncharacterized glyoxalase superfamily protein PhnB